MSAITITITGGISRLDGVCNEGAEWTQFQVDYLAEQTDGECVECNKTISEGWLCLDGGEEACNECVTVIQPDEADASLTTGDINNEQFRDTYGTF